MKSRFLSAIHSSIFIPIVAIAIGLSTTPPASSQPVDVLPTNPPFNILKSLNLSDTQRQQIQGILEKDKEARRSSVQELRSREQELRSMMDGNATRESLMQKFGQIQNLRRQNEQRRFDQMLSMREILTPQQRSQLSKAAKAANSNMRDRRERRFLKPENLDLPK